MQIVVNGETKEIKEGLTISELIRELRVENRVMAVAVNMEIVKKENWDSYRLKAQDRVELLHFVGGG